jgi:signal transduction histidine kinase
VKIGSRITIITVTLVMITLGLYGLLSVRARRGELELDLQRQTELVGHALQVALEAQLQQMKVDELTKIVAGWQASEPNIKLAFIDLSQSAPGHKPPGFVVQDTAHAPDGGTIDTLAPPWNDPTRTARLARLDVEAAPVGQHVTVEGKDVYALTVPIHDPEHRTIAAIELLRDESDVERALAGSQKAAVAAVAGLGVMLAMMVWLSTRSTISSPLKRLVEAIDDVTHGDLGRVILRERDDEVGDLAERFNEMTGSLREARMQILAGVDAKLALEARLRHSEKLATIGQLAAGIAHEVGTPLNVIGGRARTMEKKSDDPEAVAKNAAIIAAQTQRITKIIQQLLDYARRKGAERRSVNLQAVAKDCLEFIEHQLSNSRVEARLLSFKHDDDAPRDPSVVGDADQLQQVCLNLCLNAIQAMPKGGRLELSTRSTVRRRPGLENAEKQPFVILEVADTGVGIPEEDRERIFEPFYSTKGNQGEDLGGTGLGLSVSHGIVKDHDGWIEIEGRPTGGTVFRVYVPAPDSAASA